MGNKEELNTVMTKGTVIPGGIGRVDGKAYLELPDILHPPKYKLLTSSSWNEVSLLEIFNANRIRKMPSKWKKKF